MLIIFEALILLSKQQAKLRTSPMLICLHLISEHIWLVRNTNVLLLWLEKFSCTCMCTMGNAQLQARKTRAFFQPELSFKCCLFFLISSYRHGSRFHKLYEQEKKIRKIHNFFVKNQISKPLLTLDNSLFNNHSKMKTNQSFNWEWSKRGSCEARSEYVYMSEANET